MAISLKHSFTSGKADGPDATEVQPSNWNAEHQLTMATARLLGRTTAGTGAAEEISVGAGLTFAAGQLSATPTSTFPAGGIIMWAGSVAAIPSGWLLCNGASGTPDLRGRFVIGAGGTYNPYAVGGQESITQVPAHSHGVSIVTDSQGWHGHSGTTSVNGNHTHTYNDEGASTATAGTGQSIASNSTTAVATSAAGDHQHTFNTDGAGTHAHNVTGNTGSAGVASVDIRPPYYALCYIMKT